MTPGCCYVSGTAAGCINAGAGEILLFSSKHIQRAKAKTGPNLVVVNQGANQITRARQKTKSKNKTNDEIPGYFRQ